MTRGNSSDKKGWFTRAGAIRLVLAATLVYAALGTTLMVGYYRLSGDSYDYLILARNLHHGEGFTRLGLPENYRQPGYPYLVSISLHLIPDLELAGHLVALLAGVLTIPAAFWAFRRVLAPRFAVLAAILVAVNPYFINAGSTALSETSGTLFLILALGFLVRGFGETGRRGILFTACFGFFSAAAYLCRSESLLFFPAGISLLAFFSRGSWRGRIGRVLVALAAMAVLSSPYWAHQYRSTGRFSLGGNTIVLIWYQSDPEERPPESLDPQWAPRPFDPIWPHKTHPADFSPGKYIARNLPELVTRYLSNILTYLKPTAEVLFFGLGLIPLIVGARLGPQLMGRKNYLAVLAAFVPMATLFFREGTDRLLIPYLPAASVLMAIGLPPVCEWIAGRLGGTRPSTMTACFIVIGVMALPPMVKMARHIGREGSHYPGEYRPVAAAIHRESESGTVPGVMADHPAPGFWAGGRTVAIPDTGELPELVRQMDRLGVRYLVITRGGSSKDSAGVSDLMEPGDHPGLRWMETFPGEIDLYRRVLDKEPDEPGER